MHSPRVVHRTTHPHGVLHSSLTLKFVLHFDGNHAHTDAHACFDYIPTILRVGWDENQVEPRLERQFKLAAAARRLRDLGVANTNEHLSRAQDGDVNRANNRKTLSREPDGLAADGVALRWAIRQQRVMRGLALSTAAHAARNVLGGHGFRL
eukprot:6214805-Pleurochrysis_carterae.AAC.7